MKLIFTERGFTLIELIAVVVILGIVAAAAIPSLYKYKEAAIEGERVHLENSINKALIRYYTLRGEYPVINHSSTEEPLTSEEVKSLSDQLDMITGTSFINTVLNYENLYEFYIRSFSHVGVEGPFRINVNIKSLIFDG